MASVAKQHHLHGLTGQGVGRHDTLREISLPWVGDSDLLTRWKRPEPCSPLTPLSPVKRRFATSGYFAIQTHCHRTALKETQQLVNDCGSRNVPVQQIQHLVFQSVIGIGAVDLAALGGGRAALVQGDLSGLAEHALQIGQQHRRLNILPHRLHRSPAEILQFQPALEHQMEGLMSPAPMIHGQELFRGIPFFLQERGGQHFQFPAPQAQAHKAHEHLQGQPQPLALRLLVRRSEEPDDLALVGPVEPKQFLRRQKEPVEQRAIKCACRCPTRANRGSQ